MQAGIEAATHHQAGYSEGPFCTRIQIFPSWNLSLRQYRLPKVQQLLTREIHVDDHQGTISIEHRETHDEIPEVGHGFLAAMRIRRARIKPHTHIL